MNDVFLVTGGEGFIGRNIISKLRDMGGEAYSLDIVGKPDYKISITNRKKLENINRKFDGIFHLTAVTSPPQFEIKPDNGLRVNVNGTFNVLDFARNHGVNNLISLLLPPRYLFKCIKYVLLLSCPFEFAQSAICILHNMQLLQFQQHFLQ